jgi:glycosyltransferase involved in cell wall biosynthesis
MRMATLNAQDRRPLSSATIHVLYLSGYSQPFHHRKVELIADAPDVEIININGPTCDRKPGCYPSANGQRNYRLRTLPDVYIRRHDVYRTFHWPPRFGLRQFKPDLIYCEHEQESLLALETAIMRNLFAPGAPLVLYSWQNLLRPRRWYVRAVSDFTLRAAQYVFCASEEGIEVLRRQGYRGGGRVIQQMGLDTRMFYPKPAEQLRARLRLQGFVVGFIGRLVPEKGIDTLLYAAKQAHTSGSIVLIGAGPEKERLQILARDLGLVNRCVFMDTIPHDELVDYINALNLLVLPSRTTTQWKEQFGRVLTEAMACKVNVAGSDSGAIPEVIGDPKCIFPEGDAAKLSAIIDELAANLGLCRALAEHGYQRVLEHYTVERLAEKTLEAWHTLVSHYYRQ